MKISRQSHGLSPVNNLGVMGILVSPSPVQFAGLHKPEPPCLREPAAPITSISAGSATRSRCASAASFDRLVGIPAAIRYQGCVTERLPWMCGRRRDDRLHHAGWFADRSEIHAANRELDPRHLFGGRNHDRMCRTREVRRRLSVSFCNGATEAWTMRRSPRGLSADPGAGRQSFSLA